VRERVLLCGCALAAGALSAGASADFYAFDWSRPDQPTIDANATGPFSYQVGNVHVGDNAGQINAIGATFNSDTNMMSWSINVGDVPDGAPGQSLSGFTVVLTNGAMPDGPGQVTQFYFDATGISPVLTGYAYNGHPWSPSYEDGSWLPGNQDPDRVFTSLNDTNGVVQNINDTTEGDGSRTWSFMINITSILAHVPLHPQPWPWVGTGFDDQIGLWVQTFTNAQVTYSQDGFVESVCYDRVGYFDADHQPTVPAPGAAALFALAAVFGRSRRSRPA
jgi:MYXO-CTERM domain-containing protein